jgi:hypothetical protein
MRIFKHRFSYPKVIAFIVGVTFLQLFFINMSPSEVHRTGLKPIDSAELKMLRQRKVVKVRPNRIAIDRRNKELAKQGRTLIDPSIAAPANDEVSGIIDPSGGSSTLTGDTTTGTGGATVLSSTVDNSTLPSFPPIGNQGQEGSCVAWGATYYQMSHELCLLRGCNNKTIGATTFSPKWTYNMINGGNDGGSNLGNAFNVLSQHGAADLISLPYVAGDYRSWDLNGAHWKNAINYRMNPIQYVSAPMTHSSSSDFDNIKQLLSNGHVLTFGTYVSSWVIRRVGSDPAAVSSPYAGQYAASYMNGTSGGHVMTIVGYDDTIWIDINENSLVDNGEKGAFKIANSWGSYWNNGYIWLAYDAIYSTTAVAGGPTGKVGALNNGASQVYYATAKASYTPTLLAQFKVNGSNRNQLALRTGTSSSSNSSPSTYFSSGALINQGGAYSFDGSTTPVDASFVLDLTGLVSTTGTLSYYLSVSNTSTTTPLTVLDYRLINVVEGTEVTYPGGLPTSVVGSTLNLPINYDFSNGKMPPTAIINATTTTLTTGLSVNFSGLSSTDQNAGGSISSYQWQFGDGSLQETGATVNHLYTKQGTFIATLTVTDNFGLTNTASYSVVIADTIAPTAPSSLLASLGTVTSGKGRKATKITVVNLSWASSLDNVGIKQYNVYRNGVLLKTVSGTTLSYQDSTTVAGGGTYAYLVKALDAASNISIASNTASVAR